MDDFQTHEHDFGFHGGPVTFTKQILLFCNPCRFVGHGRLNLHGLQHLGICKEETHKLKQVLVLNFASSFLDFDF
jgi:hypothetical protein